MTKRRASIERLLVLACASLVVGFAQTAISPTAARAEETAFEAPKVGKPAPDFSLSDTDGKTVKLGHYRGKIVVLEWFNDGCPFVKKHYNSHNMQKLQKEYRAKGVVWLTINSSASGQQGNHTAAEYKQIEKDWQADPSAFLMDPDGTVGHLYGAKTTPDMFIIDKKGILVYDGAIDDKPSTDVADVEQAKNYVKEALDEELAGKEISTASTKSYGCSVKYQH